MTKMYDYLYNYIYTIVQHSCIVYSIVFRILTQIIVYNMKVIYTRKKFNHFFITPHNKFQSLTLLTPLENKK